MSIQQSKETINVEATAPVLNTSETRNEMTLQTQTLSTLPLPGRSMISLVTLAPGVTGLGLTGGSPGSAADNYSTETQVDASANGRGSVNNLYVVDGLDVTSNIRPGVLNLTPNPDSIQEATIETNIFNVEYARGGSVQMIMTTKSGTDAFHGLASDYFTDQHLWAGTEFVHSYAPFHSNNMSATIGGPIVPHHQAFFFLAVEPLRASSSTGGTSYTFEDPAFVSFAKANFPNTLGTQLLSTLPPSNATPTGVAQTAANVFPSTCGTAATSFLPCSLPMIDNEVFNGTNYRNGTQYEVRADKYFQNDRVYGSYYRTVLDTGSDAIRPGMQTTNHYISQAAQVNETHTFSPTTLNEFAFSFLRVEGISPQTGNFKIPVVNVTGQSVGLGDGFALGDFIQHSYHWRDVLTKIKGAHELRFGYDGWKGDDIADFSGPYSQPTFQFNNLLDLVQDQPYTENGVAYNPFTGLPKPWLWSTTETTAGLFAQDTWKASKTVTLTYGLRWDDFGNPSSTGNTVISNFHFGSGQTIDQQIANGSVIASKNILNHALANVWSPRVGVAWDITGQGTYVLRAGFGVYHQWPTLGNEDNGLVDNPPGYLFPTFFSNGSSAVGPIFSQGTSNKPPLDLFIQPLARLSSIPTGDLPDTRFPSAVSM